VYHPSNDKHRSFHPYHSDLLWDEVFVRFPVRRILFDFFPFGFEGVFESFLSNDLILLLFFGLRYRRKKVGGVVDDNLGVVNDLHN